MKLQRSTGVLLGVAIALVTTVTLLEITKRRQPGRGDSLYTFAEVDVDALTIRREDTTLSFERTDDSWQMTAPQEAPADPASVAFLLNIITTDPIKETIVVDADQLDQYGLDEPGATVEITVFGVPYALAVGDEDFSGTSRYVMTSEITPETTPGELYLVSNGLQTGIERPVGDWIAEEEDSSASSEEGDIDESGENSDDSADRPDSEESQLPEATEEGTTEEEAIDDDSVEDLSDPDDLNDTRDEDEVRSQD